MLSGVRPNIDLRAQLAALRGLRTFAWAHAFQNLALGPWAGSLERLVTSATDAAGLLDVMPTVAPRLAVLGLYCGADDAAQLLPRLPGLALGLPGLCHLVLAARGPVFGSLTPALLAAQRATPRLRIDCIATADDVPGAYAAWDALLTAVCCGPGHEATTAEAFLAEA